MASPSRTCSSSATNMPKEKVNGGLRKSFNVNVLPKATPSKKGSQLPSFTAANRPTENVQPCLKSTSAKSPASKGMKNFMSPTFSAASKAASSKKRVVVERNKSRLTCPPKSESAKFPASKEMKHFMLPTFSAASKVSSSKKRVLVERNQSKHQIVHPCPPKPASAKSPMLKGMKNFNTPMFSAASKFASSKKSILIERNSEQKKSETPSKSGISKTEEVKSSSEQMDVVGITYEDSSFMSQFTNSREECTTVLPPYDPIKKNYLSPRPDFLRYRPNRGLDDDVIEVDEEYRKREFFKFESLSESGDPGEELTSVLPPYDPIKKNFLSPRPKFLRYRPSRSLDDDIIEVDEGFRKHEYFKSETPLESEVTETKDIEYFKKRVYA